MSRWSGLIGMALLSFLTGIGQGETALAREIRFIAQDIAKDRAIWQPGMVRIVQKDDLGEPLYFNLENPTGSDHEFAVQGLYAVLPQEMTSGMKSDIFIGPFPGHVMMPIRVLVKANSTVKIEVSPEGMNGPRHLGALYSFFCPLHKDLHIGGFIMVD